MTKTLTNEIELMPEMIQPNGSVVYSNRHESITLICDKWLDGMKPIRIQISKGENNED